MLMLMVFVGSFEFSGQRILWKCLSFSAPTGNRISRYPAWIVLSSLWFLVDTFEHVGCQDHRL